MRCSAIALKVGRYCRCHGTGRHEFLCKFPTMTLLGRNQYMVEHVSVEKEA